MPLSSSVPPPPPPPATLLSHSPDHLLFDCFFTMELPPDNFQSGQSPRRQQLQGPRPAPLKVRKDSHKIRKPPVPPQYHSQPQAQPRPPVIIYTVSPKVIHANPSEFMTLVQRLTGPDRSGSTCSSSSSMAVGTTTATTTFSSASDNMAGAISPAARFASLEKINNRSPEVMKKSKRNPYEQQQQQQQYDDVSVVDGIEINTEVERTGFFPGILSPNPASLAPIPPNFFSPPSADPNPLGFFYDLSPVLHSNRNYIETASFIMPSPSTFISPRIGGSGSPSMSPSLDLFNNFFDL